MTVDQIVADHPHLTHVTYTPQWPLRLTILLRKRSSLQVVSTYEIVG
jgi:hypothetical protein